VIIAFRYLVPRQITENGLIAGEDIEFAEDAVRFIVRRYTREAGVRSLEREIGHLPQAGTAHRRRHAERVL